jgi:hypothetical protein
MANHMMQGSCKIIELARNPQSFYQISCYKKKEILCHTKYVVGAKANPPKKLRSPPKKGKVIPRNMVSAAPKKIQGFFQMERIPQVLKLEIKTE